MTLQKQIQKSLNSQLPGESAQAKMAPEHRATMTRQENVRIAAVLIALIPTVEQSFTIPLTLRHQYKGVHSGQISLPGGQAEPGETAEETALREANEEIGLKINEVEVLGRLSELYIPPSNFIVTPVVALLKKIPTLIADEHEVKEIFYQDIFLLKKNLRLHNKTIIRGDVQISTPYMNIKGHDLWGATAMVLSEFIELY